MTEHAARVDLTVTVTVPVNYEAWCSVREAMSDVAKAAKAKLVATLALDNELRVSEPRIGKIALLANNENMT